MEIFEHHPSAFGPRPYHCRGRDAFAWMTYGEIVTHSPVMLVTDVFKASKHPGCICLRCGGGILWKTVVRVQHTFTKETGKRIEVMCPQCKNRELVEEYIAIIDERFN
jgi:DNA-directed RNA polymerase subunit RPC12/RpoP